MGVADTGLYRHWSEVPEYIFSQVTPNFHPTTDPKMVSPDTGAFRVHIPSMMALQEYRNISGPTRLISGYRTPMYNASIRGSAPLSLHKTLIAWDIDLYGKDYWYEVSMLRSVGFTGFGYYPSRHFIHVDMGRGRFWFGSQRDKQEYLANRQPDVKLV